MAIGKAGATNAALLAAAVLAIDNSAVAAALDEYRMQQTKRVQQNPDPRK